ncbi:MAG: glucose-1-phosphate thymidylyltransferase RfbA [Gemmataceae bacterium]
MYNKPMIYYPLSMLLLAGIRDILVISTPDDVPQFRRLLGSGSQFGVQFTYAEQAEPRGLADAFLVGREFVKQEPVCLILGDNLFYGHQLASVVQSAATLREGALIFAYPVSNPERYGVVALDGQGGALSIEEKPREPRSRYAVPGMYFYDGQATEIAATLTPSARGELEITELNRIYLTRRQLRVELLGRGIAWLDAGTAESLLQAANFVQAVEERQGLMICCPEEAAFRMGFIDARLLRNQARAIGNRYGHYLEQLAQEVEPLTPHSSTSNRS